MNSQYAAPASSPEVLRPGDVIQQWTVVRLVSRGGMGDIYEVRHQYLRTTAALKLLKAKFAGSTSALTRIRREARIGANLKHPNLNLVYDGGEHRGQPYFLMDLLEGKNLREWLKELGSFSIGDALFVAMEVCAGLDVLHTEGGAIHRDVKPDNIFVTYRGEVKLLDLGGAKPSEHATTSPITKMNEGIGTVAYMAPEQIDRHECYGSDLYALGIVLYELIAGQHPYVEVPGCWPADHELIRSHLLEDPTPLGDIVQGCPESLGQLVAKCVAKSPAERPASALALRDLLRRELEFWTHGDEDLARRVGAAFKDRLPPTPRRRITYLTPPDPRGVSAVEGALRAADSTLMPTVIIAPEATAGTPGRGQPERARARGRVTGVIRWAMGVAVFIAAGFVGYSASHRAREVDRIAVGAPMAAASGIDSSFPNEPCSLGAQLPASSIEAGAPTSRATPLRSAPSQTGAAWPNECRSRNKEQPLQNVGGESLKRVGSR